MGDSKKTETGSQSPSSTPPPKPSGPSSVDLPPVVDGFDSGAQVAGDDPSLPGAKDDPFDGSPGGSPGGPQGALDQDVGLDQSDEPVDSSRPADSPNMDEPLDSPDPGESGAPKQDQTADSPSKTPLDIDPFAKPTTQTQASAGGQVDQTASGSRAQSPGAQGGQGSGQRDGLAGILSSFLGPKFGDLAHKLLNLTNAGDGGGQLAGSQGLSVTETQVEVAK